MKQVKIIFFLFFIINAQIVLSQYDGLQINLEIKNIKKEYNTLRFSLYSQDTSLFCLAIKENPIFNIDDYKTWLKRDADTIIKIEKDKFNYIANIVLNLSSTQIIQGMNLSNPRLWSGGTIIELEIIVMNEKISYIIFNPTYKTKERNLEPFMVVLKKIFLLSGKKIKKYL